MALLKDSRNTLTDVVQLVSGITGLPKAPAYLDLRDRAVPDLADDTRYEVRDHTRSPAVLATVAMNDPRFWWVMHDISNVVDPFDVKIGDVLLAPALDRFMFEIMSQADQ